jgi:adenine-specific DNA-methyltransferase
LESVDFFRVDSNRKLDPERRSDFGQFMTPTATARLMASMFKADFGEITLLDAGAGVGSLTAAFVDEICSRDAKPKAIHATPSDVQHPLVGNSLSPAETWRSSAF